MKKIKTTGQPDPLMQIYFGKLGLNSANEIVAKLKAQFESFADKVRENPNSDGWLRLCEILENAKSDNRIISSSGASEFVGLMYEICADSMFAANSKEALEPLEKIMTEKSTRGIRKIRETKAHIKGGNTTAVKAEQRRIKNKKVVEDLLGNPAKSGMDDGDIAQYLIDRGFHDNKTKKTMTRDVEKIREVYKARHQ